MKINKWTLGLAALGLVSLTSVAQAEEKTALMTALSATTVSGYVDTVAMWNPGTDNSRVAPFAFNAGKQDGFNLNSVDIKIAKPMEEGQWSSGYTAELMFGPDAATITGGGAGELGQAVRQAYVSLRMPIGNGLDWQIGRWDNIIGYESSDNYKNPNYSHSYAWTLEPTEHTGILASYKANDMLSISVGAANTVTTGAINGRNAYGSTSTAATPVAIETRKALVSLVSLTAPESWGAIAGSALYLGLDYGPGVSDGAPAINGKGHDRTHLYAGATVKTPVKGLSLGAAYDSIWHCDVAGIDTGYTMAAAVYASFKPSDDSKLSLHVRGEYVKGNSLAVLGGLTAGPTPIIDMDKVIALTGTIQYDLWANVISRLEVRWDHIASKTGAGGGGFSSNGNKNDIMVAANVIYKF